MNNHRHEKFPFYGQTSDALKVGMDAISSGDLEKGLEVYQSILEVEPDNKLVRERIRKLGARPSIKAPKLSKIRLAPRAKVENLMEMAESGKGLAALYDLIELLPQFKLIKLTKASIPVKSDILLSVTLIVPVKASASLT